MIDGPRRAGNRHSKHPRGDGKQWPAGLRVTRTEKCFTTSFWVLLSLPSNSCALPPCKRSLHPSHLQQRAPPARPRVDPAPRSQRAEQILGRRQMEGADGWVGGMQRRCGVQGEVLLQRGRATLGKGRLVTG